MKKAGFINFMIIAGLLSISIGLFIHCINPVVIESRTEQLQPGEAIIKHFQVDEGIIKAGYSFNIRVDGFHAVDRNCTATLLDNNGHLQYLASGSLDGITPALSITLGTNNGSLSIPTGEDIDLYLIIINPQDSVLPVWYYAGIISPMYTAGLLVLTAGTAIVMLALVSYFSEGWKRGLVLGIGVNLIIFWIKSATLYKYNSLNLEYHYLLETITPELYNDYEFWYLPWMNSFNDGKIFSLYTDAFTGYQFPPLFILTTGLIGLLPLPSWKHAIPIVAFHIATGILVYLITKKINKNEKTATLAMLLFYFSPLSLAYASFGWFNSSAFIFFLMLGIYLVIADEISLTVGRITVTSSDIAMLALAIGTLYKQFTAAFFPLLLLAILRKNKENSSHSGSVIVARSFFIYCITFIAGISPFLIINPSGLIDNTLLSPSVFSIDYVKWFAYPKAVNFCTFFSFFDFPGIIVEIIAFGVLFWLLLGISAAAVLYSFWLSTDEKNMEKSVWNALEKSTVFWGLILSFCLILFYPRGSYKFYMLILVPFISIHTAESLNNNTSPSKTRIGIFLAFQFLLVLVSRYVYFIILTVWALILIIGNFKLTRKKLKKLIGHG